MKKFKDILNEATIKSSLLKLIKDVAADNNISNLSKKDIQKAHEFASDGSKEDYYYRLKEFFQN